MPDWGPGPNVGQCGDIEAPGTGTAKSGSPYEPLSKIAHLHRFKFNRPLGDRGPAEAFHLLRPNGGFRIPTRTLSTGATEPVRALADRYADPEAAEIMRRLANDYDKLAERAEQRTAAALNPLPSALGPFWRARFETRTIAIADPQRL